MVAPSFKEFTFLSDPYLKNGKFYIRIQNPKTKTIREARWYEEKGQESNLLVSLNLKKVRGFSKGPILVVRGNTEQDEDWLRRSLARYAIGIGWYFASDNIFVNELTFPENAPENFRYLLLQWEEFINQDGIMKNSDEIERILKEKDKRGEWIK